MLYAPLSHTATVVPAVSMLGGMVMGRLLLGEQVSATRWAGAAVMVVGLTLLMLQGAHDTAMPDAWIGDLLFIAAGGLWAAYTFMLRRWGTEPVLAVSAVNVISGVLYFPAYLVLTKGSLPHVGWIDFGEAGW
jgi:drug/metabolite transporter (DMT)-like permease